MMIGNYTYGIKNNCRYGHPHVHGSNIYPREKFFPDQLRRLLAMDESASKNKISKKPDKDKKEDFQETLKDLNGEEKVNFMCNKLTEAVTENQKLKNETDVLQKKFVSLEKEKQQTNADLQKMVTAKNLLENLCRELQKQNKAVKEENLIRICEEEKKHREATQSFHQALTEVNELVQQNNSKNCKLRDENTEMVKRLEKLCEKQRQRDKEMEKISKKFQAELDARNQQLVQAKLEMATEKENLLKEKQALIEELLKLQVQVKEMEDTESSLRSRISEYSDRYDEFSHSLTASTSVFEQFKTDMNKMSQKVVQLEKDTACWKSRWETSHEALQQILTEKEKFHAEASNANKKCETLEKLCRSLLQQRSELLKHLHDGSSGPLPSGILNETDNTHVEVAEGTNASIFTTSAANQEGDICDYGDETDENRFQKSFDSILGVREGNLPKRDEGEHTEDTKIREDVSDTQLIDDTNTGDKYAPVQDVDK